MAADSKTTAIKFLGRQLREIIRKPLPRVEAAPVDESDLTRWHGTITFPEDHRHYPGMPLHFQIDFRSSYPSTGPDVRLFHTILHSHVYEDRVCFSLLSDFRQFFEATNTPTSSFWNPTRTMRSFLEDFSNFLFMDEDEEKDISEREAEEIVRQASAFTCSCGYSGSTYASSNESISDPMTASGAADATQSLDQQPASATLTDSEYANVKAVDTMLAKCRQLVLAARPDDPVAFLAEQFANGRVDLGIETSKSVAPEIPPEAAEGLLCSISGRKWDDDGVIMGFGVLLNPNGQRSRITTDLVPISYESFFTDGIRVSALGNKINGWLPFAINGRNWADRGGRAAAIEAIAQIAQMAGLIPEASVNASLTPPQIRFAITFVLGELWKTKVVELMSEEEHVSEKVLNGLFAVDHLLLSFAAEDPTLVELATEQVRTFIADPSKRIKKLIPDFGRFQPLLLISDIRWLPSADGPGACRAFVDESFTRNALWIQKEHPDLANTSKVIHDRVERSWSSSATGLRLLCFQVCYLRSAMKWADTETETPDSDSDGAEALSTSAEFARRRALRLALFSKLGGRPDKHMVEAFQKETKEIQKISNQIDIFKSLGGVTDRAQLDGRLVHAMQQSAALGYHGPFARGHRGKPSRSDRSSWRGDDTQSYHDRGSRHDDRRGGGHRDGRSGRGGRGGRRGSHRGRW